MVNHLIGENSPYLLQHKNNPVDWYPWRPDTLEKALQEDKPIFLSIGYAACHWCHVMAHESFEDPDTAAIMNQHFINIKVDCEERPDLDSIYMKAVVAMTGQGGWPMSVFLTPQGQPFYGGTYFPPKQRYNIPAFKEILLTVARLWQQDRSQLLQSGETTTHHIKQTTDLEINMDSIQPKLLDQAALVLAQTYDWKGGGWGQAPKFPQPMTIEFLLRRATRGDKLALEMATHTLLAMTRGGMYDVLGGGFSRYSVDVQWRTPHFEKMLYDNAQLALVYLHGYLITREAGFRRVCEQTLDFILRELTHPTGGFYSSLDADSEGEEGKYYLWTPKEIHESLDDPQDIAFITAAYNVTADGNFKGKNILQRVLSDEQLAGLFNLPSTAIPARLTGLHHRLLEARSKRIHPETDDKILVSWNALAMEAFAEAGRYLKRDDYLVVAKRNAQFLLDHLYFVGDKALASGQMDGVKGRLLRSWREGQARHNACLEDYAGLVLALLAMCQSDPDPQWYVAASMLADEMVINYVDLDGGFFDTRDDQEGLLYRPKDLQDNATPSGNALATTALLQLAAYGERSEWRTMAEGMLASIQIAMVRYPTAFAKWLCAADFAIGPVNEVAVIGEPDSQRTKVMLETLWKKYRPRQVVAISSHPPASMSPPIIKDRRQLNGLPTAYVCQGFVCQPPVNEATELSLQLEK